MKVKNRNTENILDMYMRCAGKGECPSIYHEWACLATIAAAVGNRVGYYTNPFKKIKPHLYTFLIGDSGVGKGQALDFSSLFYFPIMNVYNGPLTHKRMIDRLAMRSAEDEEYFDYSCTFVTNAELANQAGTEALAKQLVKAMTDWYTAFGKQVEGTRKYGDNFYEEPTINWLAGTTIEWLTDVVDYKALRSGFFGRVVPVLGRRQPRCEKTIYPPDFDDLRAKLLERFEDLTTLRGDFRMTKHADDINTQWYMEAPEPPKDLAAFAARERVLSIKLGMILSLADSHSLVIEKRHMQMAQDYVEHARRMFMEVCGEATSSQTYQLMQRVLNAIKDDKIASHVGLQRKLQKHMTGTQLTAYVDELLALGYIKPKKYAGDGKRYWQYTGKGRLLKVNNVKTTSPREAL